MFSKTIKLAVHDGPFHPDDVFAVAIMSLYLKDPFEIIRTRDREILKTCDYVFDVGHEYTPSKNIYDHHMEDFAEKRENGIVYSACGLAWKHFGKEVCGGSEEAAKKIDEKIMQSIDAEDNGMELYTPNFPEVYPYTFGDYIHSLNPTWKENESDYDQFIKAVAEAKKVLEREIFRTHHCLEGQKIIEEIYQKSEDKSIIILDQEYPGWKRALEAHPEVMFVIRHVYQNKTWKINTMNEKGFKYKNRIDFPKEWGGKEREDLEKISGVKGATFCHRNLFVAGALTEEAAITLAKLAIEQAKS